MGERTLPYRIREFIVPAPYIVFSYSHHSRGSPSKRYDLPFIVHDITSLTVVPQENAHVERAYSRTTDRSNIGRIRSVSFINLEHISLICYDVCTDKYEEMSRKHLYTPSEMYDWTTHHHLSKSHHPCEEQLTEDAPGSFPYPVPKWIPPTPSQAKAVSAEFQHMKLAPLVTAPLRTLKNSTAPAKKLGTPWPLARLY
ncbi:hypothetical protein PHLGIDRAFT_194656 [Phlebiopsis gigantea 11061_1 CR5-6]|uniref:Uncharacterized protein n=1 Tax=Phlebiopsis gigantea (strain 11061_1 CR5-6) TaxID=745531 RepID=A0A0C3RU41_PHLG1|nr:hypothetical protein PHLGIDRAFT_194656 [Phlebiopsis gigantea 11061_1 CR5-6]